MHCPGHCREEGGEAVLPPFMELRFIGGDRESTVHPREKRVSRRRRSQKWMMPSCKQILPNSHKRWVGPGLVARDALPPLPGPVEVGGVSRGSSVFRAGSHSGCWETAQLRRGRRSGLWVAARPDVRSHGEEGRVSRGCRSCAHRDPGQGGLGPWVPGMGTWCSRGDSPLGRADPGSRTRLY